MEKIGFVPTDHSLFRPYAIGYVAKTSGTDCIPERIIPVYIIEKLHMENPKQTLFNKDIKYDDNTDKTTIWREPVTPELVKVTINKLFEHASLRMRWDSDEEELHIKRDRFVYAIWLEEGEYNRLTPPRVHEGDIVLLWRYANKPELFWTILFKQVPISGRLDEGAVYNFGNDKKYVNHTVCSNGLYWGILAYWEEENKTRWNNLAVYDGNVFSYNDWNGNYMTMVREGKSSQDNDTFTLHTENRIILDAKNYSYDFTREKDKITRVLKGDYKIKVDKGNILTYAGSNINTEVVNMYTLKAKLGVYNYSSGLVINAGSSAFLSASAITLQGNVVINGNLMVTGSVTPGSCPCCCVCPSGGGGGAGSMSGGSASSTSNAVTVDPNQITKDFKTLVTDIYNYFKKKIVDGIKSVIEATKSL